MSEAKKIEVESVLVTKGTKSVEDSVEKDLLIPDPDDPEGVDIIKKKLEEQDDGDVS